MFFLQITLEIDWYFLIVGISNKHMRTSCIFICHFVIFHTRNIRLESQGESRKCIYLEKYFLFMESSKEFLNVFGLEDNTWWLSIRFFSFIILENFENSKHHQWLESDWASIIYWLGYAHFDISASWIYTFLRSIVDNS